MSPENTHKLMGFYMYIMEVFNIIGVTWFLLVSYSAYRVNTRETT